MPHVKRECAAPNDSYGCAGKNSNVSTTVIKYQKGKQCMQTVKHKLYAFDTNDTNSLTQNDKVRCWHYGIHVHQ